MPISCQFRAAVRLNRPMGAGYVGILSVELHFPEAGSLKGKRKYVKSAKAQLQHRFGASVAEVDHHDLWQRARLTVACVARGHTELQQLLDGAERYLGGQEWELVRVEREVVTSMSDRMRRVNESIRQVLSERLPELKDPRIGFVTRHRRRHDARPADRDRLRQRPRSRSSAGADTPRGSRQRTASCSRRSRAS